MRRRFFRIAAAISFSPRQEALLAEVKRLQDMWDAHVTLIHVGRVQEYTISHLEDLLDKLHFNMDKVDIVVEKGSRVKQVVDVCRETQADLLVCGALRRQNFLDIFWGTVAQRLIKSAPCPLLILARPKRKPAPYKRIIISGSPSSTAEWIWATRQTERRIQNTLEVGFSWAWRENVRKLHILRSAHVAGLALSVFKMGKEPEKGSLREGLYQKESAQIERLIAPILEEAAEEDYLPQVDLRITAGRAGRALSKFSRKQKADLLVLQVPPKGKLGLFWRLASPEFEYVMTDLPCNLLLVK